MMKNKLKQNIGFLTLKFVFIDVIGDIIYWPIWWYTRGLKNVLVYLFGEIKNYEGRLGLKIWLRSMFKPMFGQYDWQGRLISFFMRSVVLIGKLFAFVVWIGILIILLVVWILILPYVAYQLSTNFYYFFTG